MSILSMRQVYDHLQELRRQGDIVEIARLAVHGKGNYRRVLRPNLTSEEHRAVERLRYEEAAASRAKALEEARAALGDSPLDKLRVMAKDAVSRMLAEAEKVEREASEIQPLTCRVGGEWDDMELEATSSAEALSEADRWGRIVNDRKEATPEDNELMQDVVDCGEVEGHDYLTAAEFVWQQYDMGVDHLADMDAWRSEDVARAKAIRQAAEDCSGASRAALEFFAAGDWSASLKAASALHNAGWMEFRQLLAAAIDLRRQPRRDIPGVPLDPTNDDLRV